MAPGSAHAGSFPYFGVSFGTAQRPALHLGASFGGDVPTSTYEGISLGSGTILEATGSTAAGKLGIGKSLLLLTDEKHLRVLTDLQFVGMRTWNDPGGASPRSTYLGLEGGLSISFVRLNLGVLKRVENRPRGSNVLFSWGLGTQFRLGGGEPKNR
jgi:hypothetical protein